MSVNKNPFEIRAEMLAMAKDYMDQTWHRNIDFMQQLLDSNKATVEQMQEALQPYTMEELMEKAKEMYSFVSTKTDDK